MPSVSGVNNHPFLKGKKEADPFGQPLSLYDGHDTILW